MPQGYLGIDLHKASSTWILLDGDRNVLFKRNVPCSPRHVEAGIDALPVNPSSIEAVIEPVCAWRWFAGELESRGMRVHVANPLKTRLIAESRLKHDALDARMLADLLKSGFLPESYRAPEDINALRTLVRERAFLITLRTAAKNRIHGVIERSGTHTMRHRPLLKAGQAEIRAEGDTELSRLLTLVHDLTAHIAPLDRRIAELARATPLVKLMKTMPGMGDTTGVTVYAEVADFNRFPSAEKLAAYAGLVPSQRSSGASVRHGRITKTGSRFLRTAMVEAAYRIRPRDVRLYAFYHRLLPVCGAQRARIALARKMLTILWLGSTTIRRASLGEKYFWKGRPFQLSARYSGRLSNDRLGQIVPLARVYFA